MSRTRIFVHNVSIAALLQIVTMVAGLILPRVMLSAYGSEINGLVVSLSRFIACFDLVEAGISASAIYSLYKPIAQRDTKTINGILVASRNFYMKAGYIFALLAAGLAAIYPAVVNTNCLSRLEISALVLILGINGAIDFFTLAKYRVLLTADQKMYVISGASIAAICCNVVCFVGMAWAGFSIVIAKFVSLFSVFVRTALLWQYCRRHYDFLDFEEIPINSALNRRWDAFYLQILGMIHSGAPVMLATLLTDLKTVSIFSIYSLVVGGLQGVLGITSSGLAASFGDVIARKEIPTLQQAYSEFEFVYIILSAGLYGTAQILSVPFVMLYTYGVSDVDYCQPYISFLLLLNGLLYGIKNPSGMLVISAGLYKETRLQTTIQGLIECFGGLIFGWLWGLEGILYGMILSNLYRGIELLLFISKYVTGLSPWLSFRRAWYAFIIAGVLSLIPSFISFNPQTFLALLLDSMKAVFCSVVVMSTIGFLFEPGICQAIMGRICSMYRR